VEFPFSIGSEIENNKIINHWLIADQMMLMEQLGVMNAVSWLQGDRVGCHASESVIHAWTIARVNLNSVLRMLPFWALPQH